MAKRINVKEKKLYRALRDEGVSKKKAGRVLDVVARRPKKRKASRRVAKPVVALTSKVKNLRPHREFSDAEQSALRVLGLALLPSRSQRARVEQ